MVFTEGSVGMNSETMEACCSGLRTESASLEVFVSELSTLEQDLSNYWEGQDMEDLHTGFTDFKNKLEEMPTVIESIAKWGESVVEGYNSVSSSTSTMLNTILGGGK